jgi:hypothetical protein
MLNIEVIVTDRFGKSDSRRWWVEIPRTPPPVPGYPVPPKFSEILKFREDYGLEVVFPVANERELVERIFGLINAWHSPHTPAGEVARASWERWGVPLRPADVAEMEYRERYLAHNAPIIAGWGEESMSSTYAGFYMDHRAGGKIRVGFNTSQEEAFNATVQLEGLLAKDRLATFETQPNWSLAYLRALSHDFRLRAALHPEVQSLLTAGRIDIKSNRIIRGTTNVTTVSSFINKEYGSNAPISAFQGTKFYPRNTWIEAGVRARHLDDRLYAGDWIRLSAEGGCTLGPATWEEKPNLRPNGDRVFNYYALTAGHCFLLDDRVRRAGYVVDEKTGKKLEQNSKAFGTVERRSNELIHNGFVTDSEAIDLDKTTEVPRWIYVSSGSQQLTNGVMDWIPGMTLCYSGTYGGHHCGPTAREPVELAYLGAPSWQIEIDAYGEAGDSGSPVWDPRTGATVAIVTAGPAVGSPTLVTPLLPLEGKPYLADIPNETAPGILMHPHMANPISMHIVDPVK